MNAKELIDELINRTQENLEISKSYQSLPEEVLNYKINNDSWSVLECLEHLNLYGDFYLDELEKRILNSNTKSNPQFKSTWFANRTALSMLPQEDKKLNAMKTFNDKNPIHSKLNRSTIDRFIKQQIRLIHLLEKAREVNLSRIKTNITLPLIKFRLGDTFRFVIYHNVRHIAQAERAREQAQS